MALLFLTTLKTRGLHVVKWFIEQGADINHAGMYGDTALHIATYHSDALALVQLLIEQGASVFVFDKHDRSPLYNLMSYWYNPVSKAHWELVKSLIEREQIDVNTKSPKKHYTILSKALSAEQRRGDSPNKIAFVRWLVEEKKADIHTIDAQGKTLFFIACVHLF